MYSKFILENKNILSLKEFSVYKIIKTKDGYYFRFWSFCGIVILHYTFPSTLKKPYSFITVRKLSELLNYWIKLLNQNSPNILSVKDSLEERKKFFKMLRERSEMDS